MTLRERIRDDILVLDGAMGTQLFERGARGNMEIWGVEHPDDLAAIHRAYVDAGAHAITTNTFGANRLKLDRSGHASRLAELNRRAVEIAREVVRAAPGTQWVLGDVGPTGQFPEPYGTVSLPEMTDVFREQIGLLAEAGVDGFVIETMMDVSEAECAVIAAREVAPDLPVLASMTFERNVQGYRTMMGITPADAADRLAGAGADVVGANCGGVDLADYIPILQAMRTAVEVPFIAQPNAGKPEVEGNRTTYTAEPEAFAKIADAVRTNGASVIGGCCGSTPAHIAAIVRAVGQTIGRSGKR